jgi:membrane associated rhomboid family serine protease
MPRVNLPPLTRGLLLVIIALSSFNAVLRTQKWRTFGNTTILTPSNANYLSSPQWAIPYLVLIPTQSIVYPWTFLTSAVVENNVVSMVVSAVVVFFGGRYLERAWGSKEFGKFVLFTTLIPNVLTFVVYALWHTLTTPPE